MPGCERSNFINGKDCHLKKYRVAFLNNFRPGELQMQSASAEVQYPVRNLYYRARLFWNDLLATCAGKSVLLVTHSGTARALIASALGLATEHFHSFQQSNCGVSRLCFSPDSRQPRLELLNDTTHL